MSTTVPERQPAFDAHGRALPLDPDEIRRRRAEQAIRAFEELDHMGDEEEQRATYAALVAALEEDRLSFRPLFIG